MCFESARNGIIMILLAGLPMEVIGLIWPVALCCSRGLAFKKNDPAIRITATIMPIPSIILDCFIQVLD